MAEQGNKLRKDNYYPGCADMSINMQTRVGDAYASASKGISIPVFATDSDFKLESFTTKNTINVHAEIPVSQEFVTIFSMLDKTSKEALFTKIGSLYNYLLGPRCVLLPETGTFALIWLSNGDLGIGIDLHLINEEGTNEERECETIRNFVKNAKILFSIGLGG